MNTPVDTPAGVLLINKPKGRTSFSLVAALRRRLGVKKIGHAGTLDPFATGVMILLIGKQYTKRSDQYLCEDKEYLARLLLGVSTDTYDSEGTVTATSTIAPSQDELTATLALFQGKIQQVPPMFSAKKIGGKKLYELARKGLSIERPPVEVTVDIELISYAYPYVDIRVNCSKGTYIRSLANDIGEKLGCGAHLCELNRTRSGTFQLNECLDGNLIGDDKVDILAKLRVG
jgi:tRNA pseudouridine55 synthase